MRIGKIYVLTWFVSIGAAVGLYFAGLLNETLGLVAAFYFSALFFAAPVVVLPAWLDRFYSPKRAKA
jgi:hypothetical protein